MSISIFFTGHVGLVSVACMADVGRTAASCTPAHSMVEFHRALK